MGEEVVIRCHCGQLTETVQLQDRIPVEGTLCHCNSCRHVTGATTFSGVRLATSLGDVFNKKLTKYSTSEKITRYFCWTCGSHIAYHVTADDRYSVCSGAIDKVIGGPTGKLEEYIGHEFVADTEDGGLAWCVPGVPYHLEDDGQPPATDPKAELKNLLLSSEPSKETQIEAECHCGQVRLSLMPPEDGKKYEAGICACRSCRLSFSQPFVSWALNIPYGRVIWHDGIAHDGGARESVKRFQSSDHACRDFCSKCGASVFYNSSKDEGTLDLAFGILRPKGGLLAKSFFKWNTEKIYHQEDAIDRDLLDVVKKNLPALDTV